jgi:hypothetical protein
MTEKIGYCRPPKQCQFKKGQSGNPDGRRKQTDLDVDLRAIYRKVANETVIVDRKWSNGNLPMGSFLSPNDHPGHGR